MRRPLVLAIVTALLGATFAMVTPTTAAAVDTAPPAVGSCHDLTKKEANRRADGKSAVDCTDRHTTITVKIARFSNPDWSLGPQMRRKIAKKCARGLVSFFDGRAKRIQLSGYVLYSFLPKWRQRNAGANWVRCDVALVRPNGLPPLPGNGNPTLDRPPLSQRIAQCRKSKWQDFAKTTCNTNHRFEATTAIKTTYGRYPGQQTMRRDAIRRCTNRLGRSAAHVEWPSRQFWKAGLRSFVCYERG